MTAVGLMRRHSIAEDITKVQQEILDARRAIAESKTLPPEEAFDLVKEKERELGDLYYMQERGQVFYFE